MDFQLSKEDIEDILPLSSVQEGILINYLLNNNSNYFEQLCLSIQCNINTDLFFEAWNVVVLNNEMLRVVFRWEELKRPLQLILKRHIINFKYIDLSPNDNSEQLIQEYIENDKKNLFNLKTVPFRVSLLQKNSKHYILIISNHHIILDGWSNIILLTELFDVYEKLIHGKKNFQIQKTGYKEYIKFIKSRNENSSKKYWEEYLNNANLSNNFFNYDKDINESEHGEQKYILTQTQQAILRVASVNNKVGISTILYALWGVIFQKYYNVNDLVIGTTVSTRPPGLSNIEQSVGLFVNTIPLRFNMPQDIKLLEVLFWLEQSLNQREDHKYTSLSKILEYSATRSSSNLFDILLVIENYPLGNLLENENLNIKLHSFTGRSEFPLVVRVEFIKGIEIVFNYSRKYFSDFQIQRFVDQIDMVITNLPISMNQKISRIKIISEKKNELAIEKFNRNLEVELPFNSFQDFLIDSLVNNKNRIAIQNGDEHITYSELNKKTNLISNWLSVKMVDEFSVIGIVLQSQMDAILSLIGVLRKRAIIMPLENDTSIERLSILFENCHLDYLIVDEKTYERISQSKLPAEIKKKLLIYPKKFEYITDDNFVTSKYEKDDSIYIFFTSGTKGQPKGILGKNVSLYQFVHWEIQYLRGLRHRFSQLINISFDAILRDIFVPLCSGGTICIPHFENKLTKYESLGRWIDEKSIEVVHCVPSVFYHIVNCNESSHNFYKALKYILMSGEVINQKILKKWYSTYSHNIKLINLYGATETTLIRSFYEIKPDDVKKLRIPIGRPISGTEMIVLDKDFNVTDIGSLGEIIIRSPYVSKGYVMGRKIDNSMFIPNAISLDEEDRIYRTGDFGSQNEQGDIEYVGRIDDQLKINGVRVELGEVETHLKSFGNIADVKIVAKNSHDHPCLLIAYVASKHTIPEYEIREYLAKRVSISAIPSYYVFVDELPLNKNGKIDINELSKIDIPNDSKSQKTFVDEELLEIWKNVLELERGFIYKGESFFQLGGNSLKVMTLLSLISKKFHQKIDYKDFFINPTISYIQSKITEIKKVKYPDNIKPIEKKEYYNLSYDQRRLWVIDQLETKLKAYNLIDVVKITGTLNRGYLNLSVDALISKHESLRTIFKTINDNPQQLILYYLPNQFQIKYTDIRDAGDKEKLMFRYFKEEDNHVFDLASWPLFRITVLQYSDNEYYLIFKMHHIISDPWSMNIIIKEVLENYYNLNDKGKLSISPLKIQCKDYIVWHEKYLTGENSKQHIAFWEKYLHNLSDQIGFHLDAPRGKRMTFNGRQLEFKVNQNNSKAIKGICDEQGLTIYMFFLGVINLLLYNYTKKTDLIIGSPIALRNKEELQDQIGFYITTVPFRVIINSDQPFSSFLKDIKNNVLDVFMHPYLPFNFILDIVNYKSLPNRNPIFDVMLIVHNTDDPDKHLNSGGLKISQVDKEVDVSHLDTCFKFYTFSDEIILKLEFNTDLYHKESMLRVGNKLIQIVDAICEDSNLSIEKLLASKTGIGVNQEPEPWAIDF